MFRLFATLYGSLVYLFFLGVFLYSIGFVGNFAVPKTIDSGASGPIGSALVVNLALLALFAVQHSVMARPAFKRWWTRLVPKVIERSTYVFMASLALGLLDMEWQPLTAPVWSVTDPFGVMVLHGVFGLGWLTVLLSTFLINHFELFGLRQVYAHLVGKELPAPRFHTPFLYRWVRHPIYLGFLFAFWATPQMTVGHLVFAMATTGYILIGIYFEERDLISQFGSRYLQYRASVGMLLPLIGRRVPLQRGSRTEGQGL